MAQENKVCEVVHNSPELRTVADYILEPGSPAKEYAKNLDDFLSVIHRDEVTTNRAAIEATYKTVAEKKLRGKGARELILKVGTTLAIPIEKVDRVGLLTQGIEVVSNDIPAFKARALAELERDEKYKAVASYHPIKGKLEKGSLFEEYPNATVWIWCKALSANDNDGQILNLTPFIQSLTTNMDKGGGSFSITLPPIVCEMQDGKWTIKKSDFRFGSREYIAESHFFKTNERGELMRNQFLFHNVVSSNDVVWIRFETLEIEAADRINDRKSLFIDKEELAGKVYDMIGLVDINVQTINPASNDVSINIEGRDLSKLFIEDGSYFYALEMAQGKLNFSGGTTAQNDLLQRVYTDNALQYFGLYFNNSIEKVLQFVIQQLSTIKIVPNDLFTSYGNRRNKRFNQTEKQIKVVEQKNDSATVLEIKAKSLIADIRSSVELTEKERDKERSEIERVWAELVDFMKSIRTQNARKTAGELTSGWKSFVYRDEIIKEDTLPSFFHSNLHIVMFYRSTTAHKTGEIELFQSIDKYIDTVAIDKKKTNVWTEDLAHGIWQIIKLVIDKGVTNRRLVDASISSASGSLLNFIQKVCQEPFVEFYMDTYGDNYYLIARKPPYDREGMRSLLDGKIFVESESGQEKMFSSVIDIEAKDIIDEKLFYDDSGAISWYHLQPQNSFIGSASTFTLAYLPAIFFQEYADIWGSKAMQLVHNYMPRIPLDKNIDIASIIEAQAYEDLKFIIESNAYIPFTRRGQITVNGDRRLKIGNVIRYKSTGEIFFIDHVQQLFTINEATIDRTTVLQVSRGMKEVLINGIPASTGVDSTEIGVFDYFSIINTRLNKAISKTHTGVETIKKQVGVRKVPIQGSEHLTQPSLLYSSAQKYKGFKYGFGRGGSGDQVDCSGFIHAVLQGVGLMRWGTSEELMLQSENFREVVTLRSHNMKEGDVIGLDTGNFRYDRGRKYGIDHIAIVVKNYNNGRLELAESVHGRGVIFRDLQIAIKDYDLRSKRKFIGHFNVGSKAGYETEREEPIYETQTYKTTKTDIDRSTVFSNFKVWKDCFNFFMKRRMNDDSLSDAMLNTIYVKPKEDDK